MFTKTAIIATLAAVSQAACEFPFKYKGKTYNTCTSANTNGSYTWCSKTAVMKVGSGQWEKCHHYNTKKISKWSGLGKKQLTQTAVEAEPATATYADESFLDSMSAFGEAEKRMQEWQAKHMALIADRFKKSHIYFSEVRKEIAARKLEARWKRDWLAAVKAHEKAIDAHKFSWKAMKAALAKKIAADKHHKLSVAALEKATKERTAALKAWKHAKEVHAAANKAMHEAEKVHARAEKAMNHARKVFDDADVVMTKAEKTHAAAHKAHEAAIKAHKKSVKAKRAADRHERKMARARSAAYKGHQGSIKAHKAAIKSKSDARARAIAASIAVRKHTATNGIFAL